MSLFRKTLPIFKLFDENVSFAKKILAVVDTLILLFLFVYVAIYFLSPLFYKEKMHLEHATVYSHDRLFLEDAKFYLPLKRAMRKIESEPIYNKKYYVDIFFVDSRFIFNLLTFFHDYVAINFYNKIFIDKHYVYNDVSNRPDNFSLVFSEIVHEIIHSLQAERYSGWIRSIIIIPYWVKEGYAVYRSRSLKFDRETIKFLNEIQDMYLDAMSENEKYIVYGLMVKHAIEQMHYSVDDLHRGKVDYDTVYNDMMKHYKTKPFLNLTCSPKFEPNPELDYNVNTTGGNNEETVQRGADRYDIARG